MLLTQQQLNDLATQLDILDEYQYEEEQQLRLTLSMSRRSADLQQQPASALRGIQDDRAHTHRLRHLLLTGQEWAVPMDERPYDAADDEASIYPDSHSETPLF